MDWSVWFCFKKQQNPDCAVRPRCWPHHHFSLLLGLNFFPWVPFSFIFPQTFLTKGCYISTEDGKTASVCPAFYVIPSLFDCKENDIHDIQPPSPPPRSISLLLGKNYEAHLLEIHLPDSGVSFHSTRGSWSRLAWQYIKRRASSELKVMKNNLGPKGMLLQSHCSNTKHHGQYLSMFISFFTLLYLTAALFLSSTMPGFPKLSQLRYHFLLLFSASWFS